MKQLRVSIKIHAHDVQGTQQLTFHILMVMKLQHLEVGSRTQKKRLRPGKLRRRRTSPCDGVGQPCVRP